MILNGRYSLFVEWFDENSKKKTSHFSLSPIQGEISAPWATISLKFPTSLIPVLGPMFIPKLSLGKSLFKYQESERVIVSQKAQPSVEENRALKWIWWWWWFSATKHWARYLNQKRVCLACKRPRVGSPWPAHSFVETRSWNNFCGHSPTSTYSRRAVVSFWRKNVH